MANNGQSGAARGALRGAGANVPTVRLDRLLSARETAELLGVSEHTLAHMRVDGRSPPYVKISARLVKYEPAVLRRWLDERVQESTAEGV